MVHSYPKIHNVGHREVKDILTFPVTVQEKVDGSQFSFGVTGAPWARSKGTDLDLDAPQDLFRPAVAWVKANAGKLLPNHVYRGEAISKPKHNTLTYNRVPEAGFILFDVDRGEEDFFDVGELRYEAQRLGVEVVQTVAYPAGSFDSMLAANWLNLESALGGPKIEGFVIKAYGQVDGRGKTLMAKHVSESFKSQHIKDWKGRNPNRKDKVAEIGDAVGGPLRWEKAVQHLRDDGKLENSPADIGLLFKEINRDILDEEQDAIKEALFHHFIRDITKQALNGFPQWYKDRLLEEQMNDTQTD